MANRVLRSILNRSNIDDKPELKLHRKRKKSAKKNVKSKPKKSKVRYKSKNGSYGGYSTLVDHPLPHVDHEHDIIEHIAHEFSTNPSNRKFKRYF